MLAEIIQVWTDHGIEWYYVVGGAGCAGGGTLLGWGLTRIIFKL